MTKSQAKNTLPAALLALFMACVAHSAHLSIVKQIDTSDDFQRRRLVMNSDMLKAFSLGFDRVLADIWWLGFVQYYGDRRAITEEKLRYAPSYLKLVVALDPHFIRPYWFAAFVLAGDLGMLKESNDFLDMGIRNNPEEWSLPYIAGFNQALYARDYAKAGAYYAQAAKVPGAPAWLAEQAKIMQSDAPRLIKEIKTWERMYKEENNELVKEKALANIQRLWSIVYWEAPNQEYRNRAIEKLTSYDLKLLPQSGSHE